MKLIIALFMLFATNVYAADVKVLFHNKWVYAVAAENTSFGWVVKDDTQTSCVVAYTYLKDVSEGFDGLSTKTVACGKYKLYLSRDMFIGGHLYQDVYGRLIYLPPTK
jgi:hypothetical protein